MSMDHVGNLKARHLVSFAQTTGDKDAVRLVSALEKVRKVLDAGRPARSAELSKEELVVVKPL